MKAAAYHVSMLLFAVVMLAGCDKKIHFTASGNFNSSSDWTVNGQRTITRKNNGITRKLEMASDIQIESGRITKFGKGAVVKMQQAGGSNPRVAEFRDNDGTLELWVKENESFRKSSPEEDLWADEFLKDVTAK